MKAGSSWEGGVIWDKVIAEGDVHAETKRR